MRDLCPQLQYYIDHRHINADLVEQICATLANGDTATSEDGIPRCPRTRVFFSLTRLRAKIVSLCCKEDLEGYLIWEPLRVRYGNRTRGGSNWHDADYYGREKNPDRTISTDRRVIAYLRRVNISPPLPQYYAIRVPTIDEISSGVIRSKHRCSSAPSMITNRYRGCFPLGPPAPGVIFVYGI